MQEIEEGLRGCSFFRGLSPESLARLVAMARRKSYRAGESIFREGEPCPGIYVVEAGQVRVYKLAPSGKEHVLHIAGAGSAFAEVAVLGGFPCPAYAEAVAASRCLLLPTEPFRAALEEDHRLCRDLLAGLAGWVRHLVGLLEDIVLRDAAGRLARHILEVAPTGKADEVTLPALKKHLASHLNLTSETFSRTLRRMSEAGLIESLRDSIRIASRDELEQVAAGLHPKL